MLLLHIVPQAIWAKQAGNSAYCSASLDYEGFIHCSRPDQLLRTAQIHFPGRQDLLLLCIDPGKVQPAVWFENLEGGGSLFPHIYGPLNLDALLDVLPFAPDAQGNYCLPPELEAVGARIQPCAPQRALEKLADVPGGIVADIATGGGGFLDLLVQSLADVRLPIGIDLVPPRSGFFPIEQASFLRMDAAALGLADASLDCAGLANSLHHLSDPLRALGEARRVLHPGGHCLVQEMYRDGQSEIQQTHVQLHHWWAEIDRGRGITHNPTYTRQEVLHLLEGCGWRRVMLIDMAEAASDPHDTELTQELDTIINRYQSLASGQENAAALCERGEALRERVHQTGFRNASALLAIAER